MEKEALREHYLLLIRQMCPDMSEDKPDYKKLVALQKRTSRLVEMLTLFEHSWTEEIPILQKACLSYLATENLSRKERQQVIDAWTGWSDFQFKLTPYHELLTQSLQYHLRIRQELESLLSADNTNHTETSAETQEINQKGGI